MLTLNLVRAALICKVCGEQTKRHAVLCQECGLISHSRCKEFAPSCDLRAQLLGLSTPNVSSSTSASPLARFPTLPTSPSSPTGTSFALADYLPFRNSRRPKPSTLSQSPAAASTSTLPAPVAAASGAIRQLLTPGKSRTPDSTPPSSLGRRKSVKPLPPSSSSTRPRAIVDGISHDRADNGSSSSANLPAVPPSSPTSSSAPARPSLDHTPASQPDSALKRRSSRNVVVVQPGGARALGRRKSHARSASQPGARTEGTGPGGSALARVLSGGGGAGSASAEAPKGECAVM